MPIEHRYGRIRRGRDNIAHSLRILVCHPIKHVPTAEMQIGPVKARVYMISLMKTTLYADDLAGH